MQHKYVHGPKGTGIAEILQLTGVSVEMPPLDSQKETITLRGPQDKLGSGKHFWGLGQLTKLCDQNSRISFFFKKKYKNFVEIFSVMIPTIYFRFYVHIVLMFLNNVYWLNYSENFD